MNDMCGNVIICQLQLQPQQNTQNEILIFVRKDLKSLIIPEYYRLKPVYRSW